MNDERRLPPQNIEAEMSVLGGIFVENGAIDTVHEILNPEDFHRESHRQIFRSMAALSERDEPVDLITMTAELKKRGVLEDVGGGAYLATLVDFVPMASNIAFYSRIVAAKAQERRLIANAQEAVRMVYNGEDLEAAVAKLEASVQPMMEKRSTAPVGMEQSVREAAKRIERRYENNGTIQGLPYGLDALDRATSGMHPGEFIIIGGRPSMGKTALALNIAANASAAGKSVLLFSLEMTREEVMDRLIAGHGPGIKHQNIRSGGLADVEWAYLAKSLGEMHEWNFPIDDTAAISLRDLRARARRQKKEGLDLIVVDYLQLMALSDPRMSRVQGLGEISRGFKQLAKELQVPVVVLSQLSRKVEERIDKRPTMSDLRDSGEIEQDADVVMFPYRPTVYCQQCRDKVDNDSHRLAEHQAKAEIIIDKQRAGERNISVHLCWVGEYQRFVAI